MNDNPRLQRFLAEAGVAARRKAEVLIVEGRVRVNGKVVNELGARVDPGKDRVEVDGKLVTVERKVYILLNKPRGYVSTLDDPENRPTVMELLPKNGPRVYPVGRLDFNTEGLLVFTNDGDLANGLMHPRREVPKTYHAKLRGLISESEVAMLEEGIELDGALRKARVAGGGTSENGKHSWIELTITEGRNRQIHRMLESLNHEVSRLVRVGYGPLNADGLSRGQWRPLDALELQALRVLTGQIEAPPPEPAKQRVARDPFERGAFVKPRDKVHGKTKRNVRGEAPRTTHAEANRKPERGAYGAKGPRGEKRPADPRGAYGAKRPADPRGAYGAKRPADPRGAHGAKRPADPRGAHGAKRPAPGRGPARKPARR